MSAHWYHLRIFSPQNVFIYEKNLFIYLFIFILFIYFLLVRG